MTTTMLNSIIFHEILLSIIKLLWVPCYDTHIFTKHPSLLILSTCYLMPAQQAWSTPPPPTPLLLWSHVREENQLALVRITLRHVTGHVTGNVVTAHLGLARSVNACLPGYLICIASQIVNHDKLRVAGLTNHIKAKFSSCQWKGRISCW